MDKYDRYSRVVNWARRRYTVGGMLVLDVAGRPSIYSRIEQAAWIKYLN